MRRTTGLGVVVALGLTGCSTGGGASVGTDLGGAETTVDAVVRADGPADDDSDATRASVPVLPGLFEPPDERVPDDAAVRTGTLDNGLRYYVRRNDNPGGKAELRLVVDAGSVDEFGPSTGTAHFVEHMLFNGTERFPENELIDVLRSFGAAFGADVNASTSYDETVYTLTVPSQQESLATGLTVLEQWLSHATFDPDQVVAERGVVLDEWRVRTQSTRGRLFEIAADLFLADTPYGDRVPIGTDESIANMGVEELREFYEAWYRPDNAAVVVVGDIDVGAVEADIEELFGPATARVDTVPERTETAFTVDTRPAFRLHADPDQPTVDVEVTLPLPALQSDVTAETRATLIDVMIYDALVRRLERDRAAGDAPFDRISPGGNSIVDGLDAPALYAFTDAGRVRDTLGVLLDEYERADRFGFTANETDVARENLRAPLQSRFDGRDSTQDREYADAYVDDFLTGAGYPAIDVEVRAAMAILDAVTPEAMDLRFRARWANSAPHVIISAPTGRADEMPDEDEVLAAIQALDRRELTPRVERGDLPDVLMERPDPVGPASVEELVMFDDALFDPIEIEYPNGARVILNSNEIVQGQVFLAAASPGGSSLVANGDVVDALYAADIVMSGGVAGFDQSELAEIVAGRDVELTARITPYREQFAGASATVDLEILFQLVNLYMTQPRFDAAALGQVRSRVGPVVADPASDPRAAGAAALADARYPGELRYTELPDPGEFATLDLAGVERVWTSRYGTAGDWVFVLSGDIDLERAGDLANAYVGTLPSGFAEQWIDVEDPPPDEVVQTVVRAGTGDTASLSLLFTSAISEVDARVRVLADVVTEVLSARLTGEIRERLGESYSPTALAEVTTDPDPTIETLVSVTGSPDRIERIAELTVAELADLASNGPTEQEFRNAVTQVEEAYNFVNNGEFLTELLDDAIHPDLELDDYLFEFGELAELDPASVGEFVATHLSIDAYIRVTVLPR